ncbi:hypothetical protein M9Y10_043902 [Tritrichomonas musculus]|uniref:Initiator binding domain-containing protein n=1 Tax=Tritrichomonas musculus TaxID=1915356 RepID=A0ABR2K114_9EUKA
MSSYLVLSTSLGFYIFSDPQKILADLNYDIEPSLLNTLQKKAVYTFPDSLIAAKIINSFEHDYTLPNELVDFFTLFSKHNLARAKSANWYFISQILSQLVSENFNFSCYCLSGKNQRLIYTYLPDLIGVSQDTIDKASRELSLALCSDEFLILRNDIENNNDEEETINEPKTYIQDYIFLDEDD